MKAWLQETMDEELGLQIAPLIDMVFLLLIYFLLTSSLRPQESDIGIHLPGSVVLSQTLKMPDEITIEIDKAGRIILNSKVYSEKEGYEMPELVAMLARLKRTAEANKDKALITIDAHPESRHQRAIDVMNACTAVGIKDVTFAMAD